MDNWKHFAMQSNPNMRRGHRRVLLTDVSHYVQLLRFLINAAWNAGPMFRNFSWFLKWW
jgi:hypothetical protein